jgi:hypothetical protein
MGMTRGFRENYRNVRKGRPRVKRLGLRWQEPRFVDFSSSGGHGGNLWLTVNVAVEWIKQRHASPLFILGGGKNGFIRRPQLPASALTSVATSLT